MSWGDVLTELGKFGIGTATIGLVARSLWGRFLSRDLESHKAKLEADNAREVERLKADIRAAAFEHETRFVRLHEERVRIIARLYRMLAKTDRAFTEWMAPFQAGNESSEERATKATTAADKLFVFFDENQIYLDEKLCLVILEMQTGFRRAWVILVPVPESLTPKSGWKPGKCSSATFRLCVTILSAC